MLNFLFFFYTFSTFADIFINDNEIKKNDFIINFLKNRKYWPGILMNLVQKTTIPAKSLWLPDIFIINSAENNVFVSINESNLAKIFKNGFVYLVINLGLLRTRCELNFRFFPFDRQECSIIIGSWQVV